MRILVVEDEEPLADAIARGLRREGMAVDVALRGDVGQEKASVTRYDVVVLDRDLPGMSGDELCAELSATAELTRILMLTASATVDDTVTGLSLGADDYLTKPFALEELLARLRALLRRVSPEAGDPDEHLSFSDLSMDLASREVRRGERLMELTRTEFTLLELFLRRPRRVLERSFILEEVWGFDFPTTANSLEVYVGYLRRKTEQGRSTVGFTQGAAGQFDKSRAAAPPPVPEARRSGVQSYFVRKPQ